MKITSKGQVTIPEELRRAYGFLPDTQVSFIRSKGGLLLKKGEPLHPGRTRGAKMVERLRASGTSKYSRWTTEKLMKLLRHEP